MNQAKRRSVRPDVPGRVFIVDDHSIIRRGLTQVLQQVGGLEVVGEAGGAPEALAGINRTQPDLVICDLSLAQGAGLDLIKDMKTRWPAIKILVASMHDDATYAERAMRAGALGYVTKEQPTGELLDAVQRVLGGEIYIAPGLANSLMERAFQPGSAAGLNGVDGLSDRELEVFELLGDGLSTRQAAEKLALSIKTVETHRENIKKKLAIHTGAELAHRAIRWKMEQTP